MQYFVACSINYCFIVLTRSFKYLKGLHPSKPSSLRETGSQSSSPPHPYSFSAIITTTIPPAHNRARLASMQIHANHLSQHHSRTPHTTPHGPTTRLPGPEPPTPHAAITHTPSTPAHKATRHDREPFSHLDHSIGLSNARLSRFIVMV